MGVSQWCYDSTTMLFTMVLQHCNNGDTVCALLVDMADGDVSDAKEHLCVWCHVTPMVL
jgi:hypothetical protein